MKYKDIYGRVDPDLLNSIDGNLKKINDNYWKLNSRSFPRKFKASYINIMMVCPDTGDQKKHIMGPYSKKIAQSIMTDFLSQGKCCWVEEDWIR